MVDRIASTPGAAGRGPCHARAGPVWELDGAPERLTLDVDATLITAHSEKEKAAGSYKGGYGFHQSSRGKCAGTQSRITPTPLPCR